MYNGSQGFTELSKGQSNDGRKCAQESLNLYKIKKQKTQCHLSSGTAWLPLEYAHSLHNSL